ncbi:MAG TPA: hypothetical protein VFJ76_01655 [Solirubrobacterales bacterium]|nr:hypothetical protein [Solirubrobacterales bacterium]
MFRGKRRRFTSVLFLVVLAGLLGSAPAAPAITLLPPSVEAIFSDRLSPDKLPAHGRAPVTLNLTETIRKEDGSHPPPLQELDLDLDRHLGLSVKGLPRCGPHSTRQQREEAISRCEDAKVGSGTLGVEVAFPDQVPIEISGHVSVYNFGLHDGRTRFLLYTYLHAPVTGVISAPLEFRRRAHGVFGWEGVLRMPKIANGAGSVTFLGLGFRRGIFSAGCPRGKLWSRAGALFMDGTVVAGSLFQRCRTVASG